jgi:hypothetical protein
MKLLTYYSFLLLLTLPACRSKAIDSSTSEIKETQIKYVNLSAPYYTKLNGVIGDLPITMHLTYSRYSIYGKYYYDKKGIPLLIDGFIDSIGNISLSENDSNGISTGEFKGGFKNLETFEGTWTDPKTLKTLPFKLEVPSDQPRLIYQNYKNENCKYADKNKTENVEIYDHCDTICSSISINILNLESNNLIVSELITESLKTKILDGYRTKYNSVDELLNTINNVEEGSTYNLEITYYVLTNDDNILSIAIEDFYMGCPGASPDVATTYYNFSLLTGKEILLSDLINPNNPQIKKLIGDEFENQQGAEAFDFDIKSFDFPTSYSIAKNGLYFYFPNYGVGDYVPSVFIDYNVIRNMLNENELLKQIAD